MLIIGMLIIDVVIKLKKNCACCLLLTCVKTEDKPAPLSKTVLGDRRAIFSQQYFTRNLRCRGILTC